MAFTKMIGGLLKQTTSSNPSIFQAIRCMSSSKLFIGGLSYNTDDQSLTEAFSSYGQVIEARVIVDRETGRSRGFGFVTFTSSEEASTAISGMDGKDLHGRMVRVDYATDRARGGGGYGGGGGGWSGSYGSGMGGYGAGGLSGGYGGGGASGGYGGDATSGGYGGDATSGGYGGSGATGGYGGDNYSTGADGGPRGDSFEGNHVDDANEPDDYADKRS